MNDFNDSLMRENLLSEVESNWNELQTYLASLTEEQLRAQRMRRDGRRKIILSTLPCRKSRTRAVGRKIEARSLGYYTGNVGAGRRDPINAVIQQRYHDMPLDEVMQTLRQNHERLVQKLER